MLRGDFVCPTEDESNTLFRGWWTKPNNNRLGVHERNRGSMVEWEAASAKPTHNNDEDT